MKRVYGSFLMWTNKLPVYSFNISIERKAAETYESTQMLRCSLKV
jgi:hypothetical protein